MWTKTKSLFLSRILTFAAGGVFLILTFFVPALVKYYESASAAVGLLKGSIFIPMCVGLYTAELFGFIALLSLNRLLVNIGRENVFIKENVSCLRSISWMCMLAACSFAVMALWRIIFILPALFAAMLGLILRVLKNVFEKAVEIKSENDFTI